MGTVKKRATKILSQLGHKARLTLRPAMTTTAAIARHVPNSFRIFGVPRDVQSCYELGYTPLYPKAPLQRNLPKTIDREIHWRFQRDLDEEHRRTVPDLFTVCLKNGISSRIGANLTASGVLLEEVSKQFDLRIHEQHKITRSLKPFPAIHHVDTSVAAIAFEGQENFFHWIFDALPQFHLLEKSGFQFEKLYIEGHRRFQKETLALLGYQPDQVIDSSQFAFISATQLVVPSFPGKSGYVPQWACEFLRSKFLPHKGLGDLPLPDDQYRRIYLSRRGARRRKITNETALLEFLKPYGFTEVQTDNTRFVDQVRLFSNAEIVVAPHGAGLSNLLFCQPQTKVIELFSPHYVNGCFWTLCEQVGLHYHYLIGVGEPPPKYYDSKRVTDNIEVDLDGLRKTFALAEIDG